MVRMLNARIFFATLFSAALAACSGNAGGTMPSGSSGGNPVTTGKQTATATLTLTIPRSSGTTTTSRGTMSVRPDYISTNTQSMSITINGGTPQDFGLTNTSPGCTGTGSSTQCTLTIAAPVGTSETWAFALYSSSNETGTPLSIDTESVTIVAGQANDLGPYTMNPVVGSYSAAWASTPSFTANTSSSATIVLTVKDPSGAVIISPGTYETSGGLTVTFSLSDNLPNSAPFSDTSWSYALSFGSGSSTQPAIAALRVRPMTIAPAGSNQITVAYGGLSVPATTFYVNDNQNIQATNATYVSEPAVLGTPALTATCNETADACANGTTSAAATVSFVSGGDTATLTPSEPGWTDSPYDQTFSKSANTCTGGSAGSTLSASAPWTLTANSGDHPGTCAVTFEDSATLDQTLTTNASYTYTSVIIEKSHSTP